MLNLCALTVKMAENGTIEQRIEKLLPGKSAKPYSPSLDVPEFDYQGRRLERFICSCGDCFILKPCFDDHLNRKSVRITCANSIGTLVIN